MCIRDSFNTKLFNSPSLPDLDDFSRQLREVRGSQSIYHNNAIQSWEVLASGEVNNVQVL